MRGHPLHGTILRVTATVAARVSLSDPSGSATRTEFYTGEKLSCAYTITDSVCAAHPNITVAVIEYRTIWALEVVLPCRLKILFQYSRSFCKPLDTKVFGLTRAVVATAFPRVRACLKLPLTKKLMSFRIGPNLMLLKILMSFTNCEAQDLNHVTVFRMRGSEISTHHMLCRLACPMSKRTLPLNKFLPAP